MLEDHLPTWLLRSVGSPGADSLKRLREVVSTVHKLRTTVARLADDELRPWVGDGATGDFLIDDDEHRARAIAVAEEGCRRSLALEPYDEQLLSCCALAEGYVIEMDTGEGKTLVGALAATVVALLGRRVHVLSVNDYLARRDAEWMEPLFKLLGIRVAWIGQHTSFEARRARYRSDVLYAPVSEVGYDALRDRFAFSDPERVNPSFDVGIVDEADAVMIDEAVSPLVLAGTSGDAPADFELATHLVAELSAEHFSVDDDEATASLTDSGLDRLEERLGGINLYSPEHILLLTRINLALHARVLVRRDVDYLVKDGRVVLVNSARGRISHLHRWPDGLHAAIEAKEGVDITPPGRILDTLTVQDLLLEYQLLAGMSGTVLAVADEIDEFYERRSARISPHRPRIRQDLPAQVFLTGTEKDDAIATEVQTRHRSGQPVLVGTQSVAESEHYAELLAQVGVAARVLNARNDAEEAAVIARAGEYGAVTISTQMSGRGTDIRLGGRDGADASEVIARGGLAVIATSLYPSSRLDSQLRGRAGRQGDPGITMQFVSLSDEIVRTNAPRFMIRKIEKRGRTLSEEERRTIVATSQQVAEGRRLDQHRSTYTYSRAIADQRRAVLKHRREVISGEYPGMAKLSALVPDEIEELVKARGRTEVDEILQLLSLHTLDEAWVRHLEALSEIRDGIYLRVLAGQNPVDEFHRISLHEFHSFYDGVYSHVASLISQINPRDPRDIAEQLDLRRPSATWTYMVTDNPLGSAGERAAKGIRRIARRLIGRR